MVVQKQGIVFEKFCHLARCNNVLVEAPRPDEEGETLEAFRQRLRAAASDADGPVFVVSYSRKAFGQTGDGHYSRIAGYHEKHDAALILDVARFKLPPHWVPVPLLWEALQYKDSATDRCRGYALSSCLLGQITWGVGDT
jgi:glutathione gamma-glutamylcysteinyltransferase